MATVEDVIGLMRAAVDARGDELVKSVKGVICYVIGGKEYTLALKEGKGSVHNGRAGSPDVTITMAPEIFLALADGSLNPQQAFMRGSLKLKGNMALALKLNSVMEAIRKTTGGGTLPASVTLPAASHGAPAPPRSSPELKSGPTFEAIRGAIEKDGASLVRQVGGVISFHLSSPHAVFTIDLKTGAGSFIVGDAPPGTKVDLTITLSDSDFAELASGKLNAQQAFMKGLLKLKGNMGLAMKLQTVLDAARKLATAKL